MNVFTIRHAVKIEVVVSSRLMDYTWLDKDYSESEYF